MFDALYDGYSAATRPATTAPTRIATMIVGLNASLLITSSGTASDRTTPRKVPTTQRAAVCQVDGGRWLSLEGPVGLVTDPDGVRAGVEGYAARYRQPKERNDRVVIEIAVERILGRG